MAVDNRAICPRCNKTHESKIAAVRLKAEESYGKLSSQEYLALLAAADNMEREHQDRTFREDYSIGVSFTGAFEVDYSGTCTVCELHFVYEFTQDIPLPPMPTETRRKGWG